MINVEEVEAAAAALDKTLPLDPRQCDLVIAARAALEAAEKIRLKCPPPLPKISS